MCPTFESDGKFDNCNKNMHESIQRKAWLCQAAWVFSALAACWKCLSQGLGPGHPAWNTGQSVWRAIKPTDWHQKLTWANLWHKNTLPQLSSADHPQVQQEANILNKRVWFQKEGIVVDWIMLLETPPQCHWRMSSVGQKNQCCLRKWATERMEWTWRLPNSIFILHTAEDTNRRWSLVRCISYK